MGKETKKSIRAAFRRSVFKRAGYRCECCGKIGYDRQEDPVRDREPLDAHHITNRKEFEHGGYNDANGISVCDDCHVLAEKFHETGLSHPGFSPEELYSKINSSYDEAKRLDERSQNVKK